MVATARVSSWDCVDAACKDFGVSTLAVVDSGAVLSDSAMGAVGDGSVVAGMGCCTN